MENYAHTSPCIVMKCRSKYVMKKIGVIFAASIYQVKIISKGTAY